MNIVGSYEISTFSTDIEAEVKRLNAQIDLFWPKEIVQYQRWGISDNKRILDLGCGPGYLVERLSKLYPLSVFVGVEQDSHLAELAEKRLESNRCIEKIYASSILDFNPAQPDFDFVIMRLVLEHVVDPVSTLKHIKTFLKPGGKLIVIDNDFYFHLRTVPHIPELEELYSAYRASRTEDGGDPCIGRKLPVYLKKAGFSDIDMEVLTSHNEFVGDSTFLHAEGGGIPARLVKSGHLSNKTFDSLVIKWRDMLRTNDHCMYRQLFIAVGTASVNNVSNETAATGFNISHSKSSQDVKGDSNYIDYVKNLISQALSISSNVLNCDQSLINAGLDSIGASDIQVAIQQTYKINISMAELLGGLTPNDIVGQIATRSVNQQDPNTIQSETSTGNEIGSV